MTLSSYQSFPAGVTVLSFPNSAFSARLVLPSHYTGVGIFDVTQPGCEPTATNTQNYSCSPAQPGAITLPANGNIQKITSDGTNTSIYLTHPTHKVISKGDVLALYAGGGNIDIEYVDGVNINNVQIVGGGGMDIESDRNFVISNSSFHTDNDLETYYCVGGLFAGANSGSNFPPSDYGFIVNNHFYLSGMEMDASNTIVSGNTVIPTDCGGINGSLGQYDTFEGNTVYDSLLATRHGNSAIPFNRDGLVNEGMQIWNKNSIISDNLVHTNGCAGILSGNTNNVVAGNIAYDNALSPFCNQGLGGSGIFVQGVDPTITNNVVTNNLSCNTNGYNPNSKGPNCMSGLGSQRYGFDIRANVADTSISPDNHFYLGSATGNVGQFGYVAAGSVNNNNNSSVNYAGNLPEATISATPCTLPSQMGFCTSTVSWNSSNVSGVSIWVSNSSNPSLVQKFADSGSGRHSATASWIANAIYVFRVETLQGLWLASYTLQPTNFSR